MLNDNHQSARSNGASLKARILWLFCALFLIWPMSAHAQWGTTHFEVFFGSPWYVAQPDLTLAVRMLEGTYDISLDDEEDRPSHISPRTVSEIERYLHQSAEHLQSMGFRGPQLEPLVKRADGKWAYRIYFFDTNTSHPAAYKNGCLGGAVRRFIEVDVQPGPKRVIDANGQITDKGYQDLAHELFHAVQAAYPIFSDDCDLGDWISEGTAQAMGVDIATVLRDIKPNNLSSLGVRRYYKALRVEDDPPCLETSESGRGCLGRNDGYWTSSLWRYLGEMETKNGAFPPTAETPPDYTYLHRFFTKNLPAPPSVASELAWLDSNLAGSNGFYKSLNRVFSTFTTAFSTYTTTRYGAGAGARAGREDQWLDAIFDGCPVVRLNPTESPVSVRMELDVVSSRCVRLAAETGGPMFVQVTAHPEGGTALQDLWVGTQAGQAVGKPLLVQVDKSDFAEWRFRLDLAPGQSSTLVISNVASDAENTGQQTVNLRLTASQWTKNLGSP